MNVRLGAHETYPPILQKLDDLLPLPIWLLSLTILFQQCWVPGFFADGYLHGALSKNAASGGHWLVPRLSENTYPTFFHHTPFIFILQGLFFKVWGAGYTTARLFGGLFTLGTLLLLYRWCSLQHSKKLGYYACLLLITLLPLVKKSRFPNMDTPLMLSTLLTIYYYTCFLRDQKAINWLFVGLSFGFSLLIKGPAGFFPCFIIASHQIITRNTSFLYPIGALLTGLFLFSLWPMALHFTEQSAVFWDYWDFTFNHTMIQGRNSDQNNFFAHFIFLLKYAGPWVLLAAWGGVMAIKNKFSLPLIYFAAIFIPLSIARLKYDNYLLPLYPPLAVLAALPLTRLRPTIEHHLKNAVKIFAPSLALLLLIFPLTITTKRDPELHQAMELVEALYSPPKTWVIVDSSYPYFNVANFLAFHNNSECLSWSKKQFLERNQQGNPLPYVFIIKGETFQKIESHPTNLFKLVQFKKSDLLFLIPKQLQGRPLLSL